jgi:hypothetical protein
MGNGAGHAAKALGLFELLVHEGEPILLDLDLPPLRDVMKGAPELHHLPVFPQRRTLDADPNGAPARGDEGQFEVPGRAVFGGARDRLDQDGLRVRRVETQGGVERGRVPGIDLVDAARLLGPGDLVCAQVQFPGAHLGDFTDALQQVLALAQRGLGPLAVGDVGVGDNRAPSSSLERCDTKVEPALPVGGVAWIVELEVGAFPRQHRAQTLGGSNGGGLRGGAGAGGEVVQSDRVRSEGRRAVLEGELPPCFVDRDDDTPGVEHRQVIDDRVEHTRVEFLAFLQGELRLLARGDVFADRSRAQCPAAGIAQKRGIDREPRRRMPSLRQYRFSLR